MLHLLFGKTTPQRKSQLAFGLSQLHRSHAYQRGLKQRGFTLIEQLVSIGVLTAITAASTYQTVQKGFDGVAAIVGQQGGAIANTLNSYSDTNRAQLLDGMTVSAVVQGPRGSMTVANKMAPSPAELTALGYYAVEPGKPALGGIWQYSLTAEPAGCVGDACVIQRRVWLSDSVKIQGTVDVNRAAIVARAAGGMAAYSRPDAPNMVRGVSGSWTETNPIGTKAGAVLISSASPTSALDAYLPRSGARTMVGALNMSGNNINSANNVTAAGNVTASGEVSAFNGGFRAWNNTGPGEGGVLSLKGADGVVMHLQALAGGAFRLVNSAWNRELFSVDQLGNVQTTNAPAGNGNITTRNIEAQGGIVKIAAAALAGWGCGQGNGAMTTDPSGAVLSCKSGVWTASGGDGPPGTQCGSANRFWNGGWANYVNCKGQNLIVGNTTNVWYDSQCTSWSEDTCSTWSSGGWYPVTTYASQCPAGYTFQMTAHTNWGGVSGDDIFSCIKN